MPVHIHDGGAASRSLCRNVLRVLPRCLGTDKGGAHRRAAESLFLFRSLSFRQASSPCAQTEKSRPGISAACLQSEPFSRSLRGFLSRYFSPPTFFWEGGRGVAYFLIKHIFFTKPMLLAVVYCILKASWESHRGMPEWTSYPGGREVRRRHSLQLHPG